ncbi:hypothetical protein ElyMa_006046600 [Elysia marginata]|uniref:Uncharacterized protein n=1 Tax=Elysia marginata TaxID=1093978 RepID=A0AAV4GKE1_9GAST|nr:hypothetical protein ElyMa_006046600 [Elysia marginata]
MPSSSNITPAIQDALNFVHRQKMLKAKKNPRAVARVKVHIRGHTVHTVLHRLCGQAVMQSLRDREVRVRSPGRVKPRTLKLVLVADPPSVWHYGYSAKSGRPGVWIK